MGNCKLSIHGEFVCGHVSCADRCVYEEAANAEYPGRNRIEMMANPALWSTQAHTSDMERITLRAICGNSIGYGGYRTSCGIEEITFELRQLAGNKTISMQTVVALLLEMNACVFRRAVKSKHLRVYPASTGDKRWIIST